MGAISQTRLLGGLIGVGIGEIIISARVWKPLERIIGTEKVQMLLQSVENIREMTVADQLSVRNQYATGFNFMFRIMMYLTIFSLVACLFSWKKNPQSVKDMEKAEVEAEARANATPIAGHEGAIESNGAESRINKVE